MQKFDITPEEEEQALLQHADYYGRCNPSCGITIENWRARLAAAKEQGYKSEKCECGTVMLAFHHWTRCTVSDCPFSDGVSLLDRLTTSIE